MALSPVAAPTPKMNDRLPVAYIDKLQHANADDLAFYPLTTLAKAIEDGHVLACHENGDPAGYLWFGAIGPGRDVIIYQACIDYDLRRRNLGWGMVAELVALGKAVNATGIRLRCASSAASNSFWQAIGFYCTRVSDGGIKRGRQINHYRTDLLTPMLIAPSVEPSDVAIDQTMYRKLKRAGIEMPSRFSRVHYP